MFKILKNKTFRYICVYSVYVIFTVAAIPYFLTAKEDFFILDKNGAIDLDNKFLYGEGYENNNGKNKSDVSVKEENPQMESYIIGVVAAEMPVSFEKEALKAQAVAARTYAYRQVGNYEIKPENIGQAFINDVETKKILR